MMSLIIPPIPVPAPPYGSIADGWLWTLTDPIPERRDLSASLVEYLTESDFLSEWSAETGYLPSRPSVLANWQDQTLKSLVGQTVVSAWVQPSDELLEVVGPILKDATLDVIERQIEPMQAAQSAQQRLTQNEPDR